MSHLHRSEPEAPRRRWRRPRGTVQWLTIAMMGIVWMMVWGRYDLPTLIMGLGLGIVVSLVFPLPPLEMLGTVRPLWWIVLNVRLVYDLVVASVAVAWAGVVRGPTVRNAILRVPLRTHSDFVMTQVAELTTLVPGSVALELRRAVRESDAAGSEGVNVLYLHVMDIGTNPDLEAQRSKLRKLEARVIRAYGPRHEYAALKAESAPEAAEGGSDE